jgi:hypothetical protein
MADIIENTPSMEPTTLVTTNEPIVDQPMVEPEGEGDPVKKGGTSTKKDTTPKYTNDFGQLTTTATETNKKLAEFSAMVFKTTGVAPSYKGKPITDLSTISTLVDKDGKAAQELYRQATTALESPDLDEDSIASFYTQMFEIEGGFNRSAAIKQQINKNQKVVINFLAAKTKDNSYNDYIDKNGEVVSEDEFYLKAVNRSIEESNSMVEVARMAGYGKTWNKKPTTGLQVITNLPGAKGMHHRQQSSKELEESLYHNIADSGYEQPVTKANYKNHSWYKKISGKYQQFGKDLEWEYNLNKEIPTIKTLEGGIYKEGNSDAKSSLSLSFNFDSDDFLNRDDKGNILLLEDPGSKDKKPTIVKSEYKHLHNFVDKTQKMEGAIIVAGSPEDYASGVPDKTDDKVKASLAQLNSDLDEHLNTYWAHSKKLTPTKLKGRPAGKLDFQPIASGNENYQAYYITFAPGYAEKYAGSEKKKQEHPEYQKGITVFVPKEKAGETRIGAASLRGSQISNTEAAINMSPDNTYRFNIPGGGSIEASKIGDSAYTVTGNFVNYNRKNGKYDTIPLNPKKYEIGSSMALDMDGHIKEAVDSLIGNLIKNKAIKNYHNSQQGVTDPNLLKRN